MAQKKAGQVISDGVRGEPDAHHDRGETHRRDLADQGETARPYRVAVCAPEPGGLFPLPALRATFSRPLPHSLSREREREASRGAPARTLFTLGEGKWVRPSAGSWVGHRRQAQFAHSVQFQAASPTIPSAMATGEITSFSQTPPRGREAR